MNIVPTNPSPALYVITDGPRPDLLEAAAQALSGGARVLQYRDLTTDAPRRLVEATALRQLCARHGVPLIIDHDIALAQAAQAQGVHVGAADDDVGAVRAALGSQAIIGVSCGDSLDRARAAARSGANYVSFGAFFPSSTKPGATRAPIELLRQSAALGVPRVAIGGITPDNVVPLIDAGADFIAAVAAVFGAADIRAAAQRFAELCATHRVASP